MYSIKSSAMEFKNHKVYEYTLAGRKCECKAQQPDNILDSLFHILLYGI